MATYAFSDLHAKYKLWEQIKNYIKPEDTVYCLGDCVDRGDVGLTVLQEVLDTPNIIMLRGNHEDFINSIGYDCLRALWGGCQPDELYNCVRNYWLWMANGGEKTAQDFLKLSNDDKLALINKIRALPTHAEYINKEGEKIYLTHAGRQPHTQEIKDMHQGAVPMNNYIWDRDHLYDYEWKGNENEYSVHGHTPVVFLYEDFRRLSGPVTFDKITQIAIYCDGHKIDIDLGSFSTNTTCLLDLDTLKPIYFQDDEVVNKIKQQIKEQEG